MNDLSKVIIIEDSDEIVETTSLTLQIRWPNVEIHTSDSGKKGLTMIEKHHPSIVILDLGLPDMSGFDVLKDIRSFSDIPVLILTVRGDEADVVKGLELGADGYVIKPFRQMELLSRIRAILRRQGAIYEDNIIAVDNFRFNPSEQMVTIDGRQITLTRSENLILFKLIKNPNMVMSYSRLAEAVWGSDYPCASASLKVHIRRLRQKIERNPAHPTFILTKRGLGYLFSKTS
jgi:two-component system response regulator VicR